MKIIGLVIKYYSWNDCAGGGDGVGGKMLIVIIRLNVYLRFSWMKVVTHDRAYIAAEI